MPRCRSRWPGGARPPRARRPMSPRVQRRRSRLHRPPRPAGSRAAIPIAACHRRRWPRRDGASTPAPAPEAQRRGRGDASDRHRRRVVAGQVQKAAQAALPPERTRAKCSVVAPAASNQPHTTSRLACTRNGSSRCPQRARAARSIGPSRKASGRADARELVSRGGAGLHPADEILLGRVTLGLPAGNRGVGLVDAGRARQPDDGARDGVVCGDGGEADVLVHRRRAVGRITQRGGCLVRVERHLPSDGRDRGPPSSPATLPLQPASTLITLFRLSV